MTGDGQPTLVHIASPWGKSVWYVDAQNVEWRVRERDAQRDHGAPSASCLVFDSIATIRRVWSYPSNWRTLDTAGLEALSWCK